MKNILVIVTLSILAVSTFSEFLEINGYTIKSKTYLGWARTINSPVKIAKYKFKPELTEEQIDKYTDELIKLHEQTRSNEL